MTTFDSITRPQRTEEAEGWSAPVQPAAATTGFEFDVAIVGLGYVGLPTALAYHGSNSRVLALDVSERRIDVIRSQQADLLEVDQARLSVALDHPGFVLSTNPDDLSRAAAVIVCVPTPVDEHLIPDLSILRAATAMVVDHAVTGQVLMLTSTSYVGCTDDLLVKPLTERGFTIGSDVFVAFSAERIDPGNASFDHDEVPRVVGGATAECEEEATKLLLRYVTNVHRVRSLAAAEMTKLLENTFRAVNIALANEFADICRSLDLNPADVVDAAATKPYGFMPFLAGPGVGGHCIPCDPHYLLWQLRKQRVAAPMITQAMVEIAARPNRVVDRVQEVLSTAGSGITGTRVLVIGISYKPDVADLRESPALEILDGLIERGATVAFVDGHFDGVTLPSGTHLTAVTDPAAFGAELVLLHTRHSDTDLTWIEPHQLVLDTTYRGVDVPQRVIL
ncbi:nucleotide sugar dehydrogenase [Herbiconiux sp. P17]|uniref:nucleotide sugar dehydrogenase n=1 Tax=Herbiconiux wuyangfengii TaxID=3342794 RepID=UPI0035BA7AF5